MGIDRTEYSTLAKAQVGMMPLHEALPYITRDPPESRRAKVGRNLDSFRRILGGERPNSLDW
jgi:hypothetical protein